MKKDIVAYAILAALIAWFVQKYQAEILALRLQNLITLVPLVGLQIAFYASNGLFTAMLLRVFDVHLTPKEWFGLSVSNTLGNLLTPFRGGLLGNAVYLRQKYGVDYARFAGVLAATYLIIFAVNAFCGLAFVFALKPTSVFVRNILFGFFALTLATSVCLMFWTPRLNPSRNRVWSSIAEGVKTWSEIKEQKQILVGCAILTISNVALTIGTTLCLFRLLGTTLTLPGAGVLSVFSSFSLLVSVTPGNLGVREAFTAFSAKACQVGMTTAVASVVLDRAANMVLSLALGLYFSRWLLKNVDASKSIKA